LRASPSDALFDDATSELRVDQSAFRIIDRIWNAD
jgi:hypothetical protein